MLLSCFKERAFQGLSIGTKRMFIQGTLARESGVTVIWVSPGFGYPRTQIPSVLGIPSRDTQNTESVKYCRLGQVKSSRILLKKHLYSYEALSQQMKAF